MSKDNNNPRFRLQPAWVAIAESNKRLEELTAPMTVYVQATNKLYANVAPRLIRAAKGNILETLPFGNTGREQYKVSITNANFEALTDGWPVLAWCVDGPFTDTVDINLRSVRLPARNL